MPHVDKEQVDDDMLRVQVAEIATSILVQDGKVPTASQIRLQLGGGDIWRIDFHLRAWVSRSSHIFRRACEDQGWNLEKDELAEALQEIKQVKFEAQQYAAVMTKAFWDDLQDLRKEVQIVKNEAIQLARMMGQLLEQRPGVDDAIVQLRAERLELRELLDQAAHARMLSQWTTPQAVDEVIKGTCEQQKALQAVLMHLETDRARVDSEWNDVRQLTELIQKGHRALKVRTRSLLKRSEDVAKREASFPDNRRERTPKPTNG